MLIFNNFNYLFVIILKLVKTFVQCKERRQKMGDELTSQRSELYTG